MSEFDPLSFFDGDNEPAANVEATAPTATEPAAPVLETPAEAAPAAPVVTDDNEFKGAPAGFVPYAALKEERTKRQTLEEVVRGRQDPTNRAPSETSSPAAPVQIPQAGTPEYFSYLENTIAQTNLNSSLNLSEARAIAAYGADTVSKLQEWVGTKDQFWFQRVLNSADPYSEAKKDYDLEQNAKAFSDIPKDQFEEFKQWKAQQVAATQQNTPAVTPATPVAVAPSVLAAAQQNALPKAVSSGTILTTPNADGAKVGEVQAAAGKAFTDVFNS